MNEQDYHSQHQDQQERNSSPLPTYSGPWDQSFPTGFYRGRRVPLSEIFSALQDVPIGIYRQLKFACPICFGRQLKDVDGNLEWCDHCNNRGYVCPTCKGAGWLDYSPRKNVYEAIRCDGCTIPLDEDGHKRKYDEDTERFEVERYIARHYPHGITLDHPPTPQEYGA